MIRYIIVESSNEEVGPSITGVHKTEKSAKLHMVTIYENYQKAKHQITMNTDTCFTVTKDGRTTTFAMHGTKFD